MESKYWKNTNNPSSLFTFFVDSQAVGSEIIDLELILCRNENDRKKMYCLIDKIDNHQSQLSLGG